MAIRSQTINDINVEELSKTIEAIKHNTTIAKFIFRAANEWIEGGHCRTAIRKFHSGGEDTEHRKTFVLDSDEPPALLGRDRAANPVEHLLHAIAACMTTTIVYHAAARGIRIEEMESTIEGDIDVQGFLGIRDDIRRGFQGIRINFKIRADIDDEQLEELYRLGPAFSPLYDSVTKGVPITVSAQRMK